MIGRIIEVEQEMEAKGGEIINLDLSFRQENNYG
jgi:hypothetical protein